MPTAEARVKVSEPPETATPPDATARALPATVTSKSSGSGTESSSSASHQVSSSVVRSTAALRTVGRLPSTLGVWVKRYGYPSWAVLPARSAIVPPLSSSGFRGRKEPDPLETPSTTV